MGDKFEQLSEKHIDFISNQHMFFVGTAGAEGFVNVSPKGMDTFRVINSSKITWLNLTGSGNETAAHVLESNRMTIMFCSFDKHPIILRLYGKATVTYPYDQKWEELVPLFPEFMGARQIFELDLELVLVSCGYAVPYYELKGERPTLTKWTENKGPDGIREYWKERNMESLNKKPTGIADDA